MYFYAGIPQLMGNLQVFKYKLLLYGKAWRRVFQATKTTYKSVGKRAEFSSVGSREPLKCHHEKVHEETRFPSKPHGGHLVLLCEPKMPSQNGTKFLSLVKTEALN